MNTQAMVNAVEVSLLFQSSLHGSDILVERLRTRILCILKFLQKERLFGTQFLQIFCQLCNVDSQCLVPFHYERIETPTEAIEAIVDAVQLPKEAGHIFVSKIK